VVNGESFTVAAKHLKTYLGDEIRERREQRDVSQEALAFEAGLHRNVIGRLERGEYNPSLETLISIQRALDVPLSELIVGAERRSR